jgi:hypothetical protein
MDWVKGQSRFFIQVVLICAFSLVISACTTTKPVSHKAYQKPFTSGTNVLVMEPDVECSSVTASGLVEPHAGWTKKCVFQVNSALTRVLKNSGSKPKVFDASNHTQKINRRYQELVKLYDAVGSAIQMSPAIPTAKSKTNWTMGSGVADLKQEYEADYVLFILLHDQYETGGRVATRFLAAAIGIVTMPATQRGFAALVDLNTGDIVWFNQLFSTVGDLREAAPAEDAVNHLLAGIPVR